MKKITRLTDLRLGRRDVVMLDPKTIVVEKGHNPRQFEDPENLEHVRELKESIRENGVKNPLWVRFDAQTKKAILVDGETRLRAVLELIAEGIEIAAVPAIGFAGNNEADRLVLSLVANEGKPLTKLEQGAAFSRLVDFGWALQQIASKTGHSMAHVTQCLALIDSPEEIKKMIIEKTITPALAISAVRKNGGDGAVSALREKVQLARATGKQLRRDKRSPFDDARKQFFRMMKDINPKELQDEDNQWIEVKRESLVRLYGVFDPAQREQEIYSQCQ